MLPDRQSYGQIGARRNRSEIQCGTEASAGADTRDSTAAYRTEIGPSAQLNPIHLAITISIYLDLYMYYMMMTAYRMNLHLNVARRERSLKYIVFCSQKLFY